MKADKTTRKATKTMTAISSIIKNLAAASAIVGALGIGAALVATPWTASADSSQSSSSVPGHNLAPSTHDTERTQKGTATAASSGTGSVATAHGADSTATAHGNSTATAKGGDNNTATADGNSSTGPN